MASELKILDPASNPFPKEPAYDVPSAPFKIFQIAEYGSIILITFMPAGKPVFNRNIYAYNNSGDLLWIIESPSLNPKVEDPYIYLAWNKENQCIRVERFGGSRWRLDIETGKVEFMEISER